MHKIVWIEKLQKIMGVLFKTELQGDLSFVTTSCLSKLVQV